MNELVHFWYELPQVGKVQRFFSWWIDLLGRMAKLGLEARRTPDSRDEVAGQFAFPHQCTAFSDYFSTLTLRLPHVFAQD